MRITLQEARRIAHLAQLQFSDDDLERMRGHLDRILEYVAMLDALPTEGVEPAVGPPSPDGAGPGMREDVVQPTLPTDEALAGSPESGRGHYKVPRILG